eukprot:2240934-Alexandrium_andersonii.AAC.1
MVVWSWGSRLASGNVWDRKIPYAIIPAKYMTTKKVKARIPESLRSEFPVKCPVHQAPQHICNRRGGQPRQLADAVSSA